MTDNLLAGDGYIPVPIIDEPTDVAKACEQVTLRVTFLARSDEVVVARFDLDSPYWIDKHDAASGTWSLALPRYEMLHLLCTLRVSPFMKIEMHREELLA